MMLMVLIYDTGMRHAKPMHFSKVLPFVLVPLQQVMQTAGVLTKDSGSIHAYPLHPGKGATEYVTSYTTSRLVYTDYFHMMRGDETN